MAVIDVAVLFVAESAASIFNAGLDLAAAVGLPVTTWRAGDPTKSLYQHLGEVLAKRDEIQALHAKSGFLSTAEGDWKKIVAKETYGITPRDATYSTPEVTLRNNGGAIYPVGPGAVTLKCQATGVTFHSTGIVTGSTPLIGGADVTLSMVADTPGSAGTVGTNDIDAIVTSMLGVVILSSTASIALDEQDGVSLEQDCNDTLGALSPDGPADAYEFVVRQAKFTGLTTITRSRATNDSDTGQVTVYVCGPDGTIDGGSITAAQDAAQKWATPLCIRPTVVAATRLHVNVSVRVPAGFPNVTSALTTAHQVLLSKLPIGDEDGESVFRSALIEVTRATMKLSPTQNIELLAPAADLEYDEGFVPVLGTVTVFEV